MVMTPTASPDAVSDLLDQHAVRRSHHVPALSVLVGPPLAGLRRWQAWLAASRRPSLVTTLTGPAEIVHLLITALAQRRGLADDAIAAVARWSHRPADELRSKLAGQTEADFDLFLDLLPIDPTQDPVAVTFLLLRWRHRKTLPAPEQLLDQLVGALPWPKPAELRLLVALASITPDSDWPALCLLSDEEAPQLGWLSKASRVAAALASHLPSLPIGLAIVGEVLDEYLRTAKESQAVALLCEGFIVLPQGDREALSRRVEEMGLDSTAAAPAIEAVLERGGDAGLVNRLAEVSRAVAGLVEADEQSEERARSQAEQFLFELLDSHPSTAGLFELNGTLDFRFGSRPAEVDLLARTLFLAVELDGGFWHLQDRSCYPRDRRKDWELQRHGFLVLRFLAEDVVYQPQEILDTIRAAVAYRRQPTK